MTGAGALSRKGFVASSGGLAKGFVAASVSGESSAVGNSAGAAATLLAAGAASDGSFLSACILHKITLVAAMIAGESSGATSKSATTAGAIGTGIGISFCPGPHTHYTDAQGCYSDGAGNPMQQPLQQLNLMRRALLANSDRSAECNHNVTGLGH